MHIVPPAATTSFLTSFQCKIWQCVHVHVALCTKTSLIWSGNVRYDFNNPIYDNVHRYYYYRYG